MFSIKKIPFRRDKYISDEADLEDLQLIATNLGMTLTERADGGYYMKYTDANSGYILEPRDYDCFKSKPYINNVESLDYIDDWDAYRGYGVAYLYVAEINDNLKAWGLCSASDNSGVYVKLNNLIYKTVVDGTPQYCFISLQSTLLVWNDITNEIMNFTQTDTQNYSWFSPTTITLTPLVIPNTDIIINDVFMSICKMTNDMPTTKYYSIDGENYVTLYRGTYYPQNNNIFMRLPHGVFDE